MSAVTFTKQEQELVSDITQIALWNAATSFSKMIKDDVLLKNYELAPIDIDKFQLLEIEETEETENNESEQEETSIIEETKEVFYVLKTPIIGDLSADTYFLVTERDEKEICKMLLPDNMLGQTEMREAMLLELDNIITASIVTKYSDILDKEFYGNVPVVERKTKEELREELSTKMENVENGFSFKADVLAFHSRICVEFICFFDESIIAAFKEVEFKDIVSLHKTKNEEAKEKKSGGFFKDIFG